MLDLPIVKPKHPDLNTFRASFEVALAYGQVTNNGAWVQRFEAMLTEYLKTPTIVFSSGQAALMTMLAASDVRGGEVITPSLSFCATPHAIRWAGAHPSFADIEEDTLCMDAKACAHRLGPMTRAILGVDPYGILWEPPIYQGSPIKILCDSAPSFGSRRLRKGAGVDARIYSFHATKPFSTMEGGALSSNDPDFINRCKRIRNFGQDDGGDCDEPGINGKMLEVCAMIGLRQFETWSDVSMSRYDAACDLGEALQGIEGLKVVRDPPSQASIWLYRPVLVTEEFGMSRDAVVAKLKELGIQVRTYYRPAHLLSCYKHMNVSLPVTERIASQVIALPVYSDMSAAEIERIASAFKKIRSAA